jgi:hypothetical protein
MGNIALITIELAVRITAAGATFPKLGGNISSLATALSHMSIGAMSEYRAPLMRKARRMPAR